ncbi:MAG TPA: hypothetical protein VK574_03395 [Terracidiphilus sp.]|nr:hypothetical protein [Terracidiphilus sp.]
MVSTLPNEGTFVVDEVWKGDLRPGARLAVPVLIPSDDAVSLSFYMNFSQNLSGVWTNADRGSIAEKIPREPVGSQMILFLESKPSNSQEPRWEPGNWMGSMKASVVWIEGDQLWSFVQVINAGPAILQRTGTLQNLKERVTKVLKTQKEIQSVLSVQDPVQRAQLLKLYLKSDVSDARKLALEELGKSGPAAVPIIRQILDDSSYAEEAPGLIEAVVKAGGPAEGADLNERFKREVAFWESTGPSLQQGWWNGADAPLRLHYSQTYQLIIGLQKTLNVDALASVKQLDDLWVSHPQLNDSSGLNQISFECERLMRMMQPD